MPQTATQKPLYDSDFNLWVEDTVAILKTRQFDQLDLDNLIEEVEGLTRRDKRELKSRLRVLLNHLLKRGYVDFPDSFRGWEATIREQRSELQLLLEQSPSLKSYFVAALDESWKYALSIAKKDYPSVSFPEQCPFPSTIEALLSQDFWQDDDLGTEL
jgi:hypothetical protein